MRVTSPAVSVKDIWDALVADYGVAGSYGLLVETNLDGQVSLAKANVSALALEATLDEAKEKDTSPAFDADTDSLEALAEALAAIPTTMVGTDSAALASAWTAALATILGNFSQSRIEYLDNIDASLKELFYEHFSGTVDDLAHVSADGDVSDPTQAIDNDTTTAFGFASVNKYLELNFGLPVYIKKMRYYGNASSNPANRYRLQAYVDGSWVDGLTGIVDIDAAAWDSWRDLTTPRTAILWRFECTTFNTFAIMNEVEFMGVGVGG